jgi:Succinylglutamate desuccinylase / Aspartoacylase family
VASNAVDILAAAGEPARVLGRVTGLRPGATLLCIGGLHGNEPAGLQALRRVLRELPSRREDLSGEFVALSGNRAAIAAGKRFITRDLNRAWTPERLVRLRVNGRPAGRDEDREQVELLAAVEEVVARARGPVYLLDLHTTSGHGGPFLTFGDALPHRAFAAGIPVPMILGLEELVEGTLLAFLGRHGVVGVTFETGQHEEPRSVDRAEAGIWLAVAAAGLVPETRLPEAGAGRELLRRDSDGLPRVLELRYRHHIEPEDRFRMRPGYGNFQPVRRGEVVADDARGAVRLAESGRMLMPLYQQLGEDGFFLMRAIRPFWLWLSLVLRTLRVDRIAHWLPGVRREPVRPEAVVVERGIARWYAVELFHLLGYRIQERDGSRVILRRRRFDEAPLVERDAVPGPPG